MYRTKRRLTFVIANIVIVGLILFLTISIIPSRNGKNNYSSLFTWISASALVIAILLVICKIRDLIVDKFRRDAEYKNESAIITEFISKLKFCYSYEGFYKLIGDILEKKGDASAVFIERKKNYILYSSPDRLTMSENTLFTLELNFGADWNDGFFFIGDNFGIVSNYKKARGFFLVSKGYHLYVFCRYTKLFDPVVYKDLFDEYCNFQKRTSTINGLSEIASLSQEWQQLANTQRSFLPPVMPKIDQLELAAYFRPLINVSGDYYSVLPITPSKTLLMLGDVSGKGLAAALVMGLVMNTVKILEDKDDLPSMIRAVDRAIKGMHLQDKYTVLFIGIVDTMKMTIRYVNASMSDPLIITNSADGWRIKPLTSNCSVVGIIPIDDIRVDEQKLFRGDVIFMSSDGVSEVMDDNGVELGDTELYQETIKSSAEKHPKEFVDNIVNLVMSYNGNKKLHDDVTMMVAKVVE